MNNVKISVIIPVYNAEEYLTECLESVLNQSLKDIEVICVDDGSTDSSMDILKSFEASDNRVKVLSQKNEHAGVARNKGMSVATGEYIHFLDSDDYVLDYAYESLYKRAHENQLDCLKCRSVPYDMERKIIVNTPRYLFSTLKPEDYNRFLRNDEDGPIYRIGVVPWNGIYRRAFLEEHNIKFNSLFCVNDRSFYCSVLTNAKRFMVSRDWIVVHRVGQGDSLVGRRAKHFDCQIESVKIISNQLKEDGINSKISELVMLSEISDLFVWYKKYQDDAEYGEKIYNDTKKFVEEYQGVCKKQLIDIYHKHINDEKKETDKPSLPAEYSFFQEECKKPKISVIIPVYNAQNYLQQCLDSIMQQTMQELEIICVDEDSTDLSEIILEEYAAIDKRIRIMKQDKQSPSEARNCGIKEAKGEYLLFPEMGDSFDVSLFDKIYKEAVDIKADIAICEEDTLGKKECYPWIRFCHRDFITEEEIYFPEISHSNDTYFSIVTMAVAKKIAYINEELIFHKEGQYQNLQYSEDKKKTQFLDTYEKTYQELIRRKIYDKAEKDFINRIIVSINQNLSDVENEIVWKEIYDESKKRIINNFKPFDHPEEYFDFPNEVYKLRSAETINRWLNEFCQKKDSLQKLAIEYLEEKRDDALLDYQLAMDIDKEGTGYKRIYYVYEVFYCYLEMQKYYIKKAPEYISETEFRAKSRKVLELAKTSYAKLKAQEKLEGELLPFDKRELLSLYIIGPSNYSKEIKNLKTKIRKTKAENMKIKDSGTYKIGKLITWIPRKIKRVFK